MTNGTRRSRPIDTVSADADHVSDYAGNYRALSITVVSKLVKAFVRLPRPPPAGAGLKIVVERQWLDTLEEAG